MWREEKRKEEREREIERRCKMWREEKRKEERERERDREIEREEVRCEDVMKTYLSFFFWKNPTLRRSREKGASYKKSIAWRKILRCRSNEFLKLWGASTNKQMVSEMLMNDMKKSMHNWPNEPLNQWMSQWTNDWMMSRWISESMNRSINEPVSRWVTEWAN